MTAPIRRAEETDFAPLARLWHAGWVEAHAEHVPPELTARRTLARFHDRLIGFGEDLRVAGPVAAPTGLCVIQGAALDQLFVAPSARGTGLAAQLLADGENRLRQNGVRDAYLLCVVENAVAARFYTKQGWVSRGPKPETIPTEDGPVSFDLLRFEKTL